MRQERRYTWRTTMATNGTTVNKLSKEERKALMTGLDMSIASMSRQNAREGSDKIKQLREEEIQRLVALKNRLASMELEL